MRPCSILNRYIFREIFVCFLFCFSVFLFSGIIAGFLPLLQKGMEAGLTFILFQVLINALPGTLVTVLPLSITIGILLGLGRMASDNEIAAIKSSGISIWPLIPPVLMLGLIGFILSMISTLILIPKGISEGRKLLNEAVTRRADAGIDEGTFFDNLKNLVVYVEKKDPVTGVLNHVFIKEFSSANEPQTIIAQSGQAKSDPEGKALILLLSNGSIIREDKNGDAIGSLAFETYVFRYPLNKATLENSNATFEELSISEIRERVKGLITQDNKDLPGIEIYQRRVQTISEILIVQRFIHPLACIALAFAAFPLGALNFGKSRLNNVAIGMIAVFVYYGLTLASERMARSDLAPPEIVLPLPPLIFALLSAYFTRCVDLERAPGLIFKILKYASSLRPKIL